MTIQSLDRVVQYAGTAAFGRNAVVFVWIAMAYSALMAIFLSFATIAMYYDPVDATFFEDLVGNTETTTIRDNDSTLPRSRRTVSAPVPLDAFVHYLDSKTFYAPKEATENVKFLR